MDDNYVFKGHGAAIPDYKVTTDMLENMLQQGYLTGFSPERIEKKPEFREFLESRPNGTPLEFFIEDTLGFKERYHVAPFPPNSEVPPSATSVDLGAAAVKEAIYDSGLETEDIGLMIVTSTTPPSVSPGIAETIRDYVFPRTCGLKTLSVVAGCGGFVLGVDLALSEMERNKSINNVVVAHTETMSRLLTGNRNIITHATCGDGASAAVISRAKSGEEGGITGVNIFQDSRFAPYLYVTEGHQLYIDVRGVGKLAVEDMTKAAINTLKNSNLDISNIDLFIPHQTGNQIIDKVADNLSIPKEGVYKDTQIRYGNVSGTTIPLSLYNLSREGRLLPGMSLLCAATGVGGISGAFLYKVLPDTASNEEHKSYRTEIDGKLAVITGATGSIGKEAAMTLSKQHARLALVYSKDKDSAQAMAGELVQAGAKEVSLFQCNLRGENSAANLAEELRGKYDSIDYIVHCAGIPGSVELASKLDESEWRDVFSVNYEAPRVITLSLKDMLNKGGKVVYLGSAAQDYGISGSAPYVASKEALKGFAASMSQELLKSEIESIFFMPGLVDSGMSDQLSEEQKASAAKLFGQARLLKADRVGLAVAESLYLNKVVGTKDSYENRLLVRRMGYEHI